MVLTRAQRAQTKTESPEKSGVLSKAPARRGAKAKKTEVEEEKPKPAAKTARATTTTEAAAAKTTAAKASAKKVEPEAKDKEVKRPASRATTERPASRTTFERPESRSTTERPASRTASSRTASARSSATGTTKASAAKATAGPKVAAKTTTSRAATTKAAPAKAAVSKASAARKTGTATKVTKTTKAAREVTPVEEPTEDAAEAAVEPIGDDPMQDVDAVEEPTVNPQEIPVEEVQEASQDENAAHVVASPLEPVKIQVMTLSQASVISEPTPQAEPEVPPSMIPVLIAQNQDENAAPSSPTKLPQPIKTLMGPPASPFKSSILSTSQGLGSVRKPPVSGALFNSPTKAAPSMVPPAKPLLTAASPVRLNTSIHDFATMLGSPRRPGSSGSDSSAASRQSTPKRPHNDENVASISSKRVRTSISMPQLGSPVRSQSSTSGSPPSPTKSSMRSPEKRPNMSPKKVSWHQTPPRQALVQERTPPSREPGILDGCVFFLDVNSLTGSNQNPLFAPLIEELGGQCVQQWSHNNMGITHVLFMNGEMRTLEKVLATNGEVFCVSLGWLLDCQRENLRIPESQPRYLIDLTHVPGHTPKPNRSALNTPMTARSAAPISHTPAIPPPKWALPNTPAAPRSPLGDLKSSMLIKTPAFMASKLQTPGPPPSVGMGTVEEGDKENVSPVSEGTPLMQKTCPPKQLNKSILAMSTGISATPLRNKFLASKRRRSFDGVQKPKLGLIMGSPPRKLGLGSPKRQSPLKRKVAF